jgi:PAS domain S-box-containing protein
MVITHTDITASKLLEVARQERVKELGCLYAITDLIRTQASLAAVLEGSVALLPAAWRHSEVAVARIVLAGQTYQTANFRATAWRQAADITVAGQPAGQVEVCYLEARPRQDEGPFLAEERHLIEEIASRLGLCAMRRRTATDLAALSLRYQTLLQAGSDAVHVLDARGNVVEANQAFCTLLGYTRAELAQLNVADWDTQRSRDEILTGLAEPMAHPSPIETRHRRKDGTVLEVEINAVDIVLEGSKYRFVSARDITARKRTHAALQESEDNLQLLLNSTAEAIYGIDLDGNCTFCNSACLKMLGYARPEDLLGQNMHWQIHGKYADGSRFPMGDCQIYKASIQGVNAHVDNEVLWRADGTSFPVEYWSYSQRRNGVVIGAVVTFVDITARKQAEAELLRALAAARELNTLKSAFVAMVSHEFRTPLGAILGAAELIEDFYDRLAPEKRTGYFQIIRRETNRLTDLLDEVLLQGELDAGTVQFKARPTDVVALLHTIVKNVQATFPIHPPIQVEAPAPGTWTLADEILLERMVSNLLGNACKYSPALKPVRLTVQRVAEQWQIEVQDQGIGISEADQETLFTAFQRGGNVGNIKGTGMGLYIVKKCAELQGGRVGVRSQVGQGSTFWLVLPAPPVPPTATACDLDHD